MTLILQKRVSVDTWKLPDILFGQKYITLHPLYSLETVFIRVWWYGGMGILILASI